METKNLPQYPFTMLSTMALLSMISLSHSQTTTESPTLPPQAGLNCRTFESIYGDGKALCENIFDNSFKYVPKDSPGYQDAYSMWFFAHDNPNDAAAKDVAFFNALGYDVGNDGDQCFLQYVSGGVPQFKETASGGGHMTECSPFSKKNCCPNKIVASPDAINVAYGDEYRWDRCGQLSPACERFFVQESCFYQCDRNTGYYRAFPPGVYDPQNDTHNLWQISNMPIKGEYCDAWYESCRYDKFCSNGGGSFFACAMLAPIVPPVYSYKLQPGVIAGIVIGSFSLFFALVFLAVLIRRELRGKPMFLNSEESDPLARNPGTARGIPQNKMHLSGSSNANNNSGIVLA